MPTEDSDAGGEQRGLSTSNHPTRPGLQSPRHGSEQRGFRSALRAHSRHSSASRSHSMTSPANRPLANGSTQPNERTHLLSGLTSHFGSDGEEPIWKDQNRGPWVRWPAYASHIALLSLTNNYVNVLLVFVPLGIISGAIGWSPTVTFILNFFAIIPLASLLSFATEELSIPLGQTIGGLMNATFGNAVELIVCTVRQCTPALLKLYIGEHRCSQEQSDPHSPGQHARQYSLQHSPCPWLLFRRRRASLS